MGQKTKKEMRQINEDLYVSSDGHTMRREEIAYNMWVYRDWEGNFIDKDQYRIDLAERHDLELISKQ